MRFCGQCRGHCAAVCETEFCYVGQAALKLLTSGDPPTSASQSTGIMALWEAEAGGLRGQEIETILANTALINENLKKKKSY
ncbi:hypothetical protein AAY473_021027, partial [Plecturocebus cupreus]